MTNFVKIKRTIQALQYCYPNQTILKDTIVKCLCDSDFQSKYVIY